MNNAPPPAPTHAGEQATIAQYAQWLADAVKELAEWKQIVRNRDETVNRQGDEWVKLKTEIDSLRTQLADLRQKLGESEASIERLCELAIQNAEQSGNLEVRAFALFVITELRAILQKGQ